MGSGKITEQRLGRPWSVQIEMVEGCSKNPLCDFCGLNGIRDGAGDYKFMTIELAERVAAQLADLCPMARMEFAMHGEPLMNPKAAEIASIFRCALPKTQIQLTTNGGPLMKDMAGKLNRLYDAGIDFVMLDTYYPERDKLRGLAANLPADITVWDFYDDCAPKGWSPWHNHGRKHQRLLVLMDDLAARDGEINSRVIMNHAGNMKTKPIPPEPLVKTCTNPFREISVCWNGAVNVCCMDWAHEATMGNIATQTAASIWWGKPFEAFRTALQNKDRRMSPCSRCDKNSGHRAGLLPKYPEVTRGDINTIKKVHAANPKPKNGYLPICEVQVGTRR
jgi:hypothetical protein